MRFAVPNSVPLRSALFKGEAPLAALDSVRSGLVAAVLLNRSLLQCHPSPGTRCDRDSTKNRHCKLLLRVRVCTVTCTAAHLLNGISYIPSLVIGLPLPSYGPTFGYGKFAVLWEGSPPNPVRAG